MLLIALYTTISLHNPSLLDFSTDAYTAKGGDHLTDELFLFLLHYFISLALYAFNIVLIIRNITRKKTKAVIISVVFILLLLGISSLIVRSGNAHKLNIEETHQE